MGNIEKRLKTTEKTVEITIADKIDKPLKHFRYEMDYNCSELGPTTRPVAPFTNMV